MRATHCLLELTLTSLLLICSQTQLLHHLCVQSQLGTEDGGANGKVIFLDTEGGFRPERVAQMAQERFQLEKDEVMENVLHARITTHEILVDSMNHVAAILSDPEKGPFRMLIIDSLMHNFRTEFSGRGGARAAHSCSRCSSRSLVHHRSLSSATELAERQQVLAKLLKRMSVLAQTYKIAVVYSNQVMADPSAKEEDVATATFTVVHNNLGQV